MTLLVLWWKHTALTEFWANFESQVSLLQGLGAWRSGDQHPQSSSRA